MKYINEKQFKDEIASILKGAGLHFWREDKVALEAMGMKWPSQTMYVDFLLFDDRCKAVIECKLSVGSQSFACALGQLLLYRSIIGNGYTYVMCRPEQWIDPNVWCCHMSVAEQHGVIIANQTDLLERLAIKRDLEPIVKVYQAL